MAPGFGLPVGVDDGAAFVADFGVEPDPGLGVDGLADRAEEAERGEGVAFEPLLAPLNKGADGSGGGVEDGDFVGGDDLPEAVVFGEVGGSLVHKDGCAVLGAGRRRRSCGL